MKTFVTLRLLPLVVLAAAVIATAMGAGATTPAASKTVPYCKTGQKTTKAHPCKTVPKCKTGQKSTKLHPCVKPKATTPGSKSTGSGSSSTGGSTTTGSGSAAAGGSSSSGGSTAGSGGQQIQADGCPIGQSIPQGTYAGDGDEDNAGQPDDGDGCS